MVQSLFLGSRYVAELQVQNKRVSKEFEAISATEILTEQFLIDINTGKETNICLSPWERVTEVN